MFSSQNAPWCSEIEICTVVQHVNTAYLTRPGVIYALCVGGLFNVLFSSVSLTLSFRDSGGRGGLRVVVFCGRQAGRSESRGLWEKRGVTVSVKLEVWRVIPDLGCPTAGG